MRGKRKCTVESRIVRTYSSQQYLHTVLPSVHIVTDKSFLHTENARAHH